MPEALRNEAVRVKAMIERVGQALVQRGLLTQASFDKYRGEYLPRLYLKYMLPEGFIRAAAGGRKVSDLGYLLKRGDIPPDIRRLVLGEIKDPGYLAAKALSTPMRDMAILDFLNDIARDTQWMFEDSIVAWEGEPASARWLSQEAARIRKQAESMATEQDRKDARDLAKRMDAVADPAIEKLGKVPDDYREVPDSKRYGRLAGMWVRK